MTKELKDGNIYLRFADEDFHFKGERLPGGAQAAIGAIKLIGHVSHHPNGWSYDLKTRIWVMRRTPANERMVKEIEEFYLTKVQAA